MTQRPRPTKQLARLAGGACVLVLAAALAGCSGGSVSIGDSAKVTMAAKTAGNDAQEFTVTVASLDEAPAAVAEQIEGDDTVYFASIDFSYAGDASADVLAVPWNNVYAELSDGTFLDTSFIGLSECSGTPEDPTTAVDDLASGKTVTVCIPLSSDGDTDLTGVYVGNSDVNDGGTVWKK
ncbi:hypothetical protein KXS11_11285 [Plantibacter flavus]|uniref:hypothetical protein n=1 Tax=Plantibacter flavus TaxID=150123 RepID=UPI003F13C9EA